LPWLHQTFSCMGYMSVPQTPCSSIQRAGLSMQSGVRAIRSALSSAALTECAAGSSSSVPSAQLSLRDHPWQHSWIPPHPCPARVHVMFPHVMTKALCFSYTSMGCLFMIICSSERRLELAHTMLTLLSSSVNTI